MSITFLDRNNGLDNGFAQTSQAITLANTGSAAGDLRLVFVSPGTNATVTTTSTGWTKLLQGGGASDAQVAVFAGVVGTADSLTVQLSASQHVAYCTMLIHGWSGNLGDIQISSFLTGSTTTHPNPSLTSTVGSVEHGWIVVYVDSSGDTTQRVPGSAPSGYANYNIAHGATSATSDTAVITAEKVATAETESPGNWSNTSFADAWASLTIGVPVTARFTKTSSDTAAGTENAQIGSNVADSAGFSPEIAKVAPNPADSAVLTESANVFATVMPSDTSHAIESGGTGTLRTKNDDEPVSVVDLAQVGLVMPVSDAILGTDGVNFAGVEVIRVGGKLLGERIYYITPEVRRYLPPDDA